MSRLAHALKTVCGGVAVLTILLVLSGVSVANAQFSNIQSGSPQTVAPVGPGTTEIMVEAAVLSLLVTTQAEAALGFFGTGQPQIYIVGDSPDVTLLAAGGGTAPYVHTLTGPNGGALPAGLRFEAVTRKLLGVTTTAGIFMLTHMVIDGAGDSITRTIMVTINANPNAPHPWFCPSPTIRPTPLARPPVIPFQ